MSKGNSSRSWGLRNESESESERERERERGCVCVLEGQCF